ncbi:MAG: hypothetical protein ABR909_02380 [Candidatus Bathyarchaeia archaeon]
MELIIVKSFAPESSKYFIVKRRINKGKSGTKMRKDIIKQIQDFRGSKVIVYFTGDRQLANARIAEDAVRPLYDHLLSIGKTPKIDLYLYSRGGNVSVPWRIVTMFREFCDELSVIVPYKAYSATTLISLGADSIIMGKKAELGPIDPTLEKSFSAENAGPPEQISVEDVNSFLSFVKERGHITDQAALAQVMCLLANQLTPLTLGSVNRTNSHIRLVARKLLTARKEKFEESKINSIIETLTEKMYSHGHGIGRKEALEIGLPIKMPEENLETVIWQLYLEYEQLLKLNEHIDPIFSLLGQEQVHYADVPIGIIESENLLHAIKIQIDMKKRRQIPPSPQINLNVNLSLPPGIRPEEIPQQAQQILQQMLQQVTQSLPPLVQGEIIRQSPETGIESRAYGARWLKYNNEDLT